jgi:hypothetical protein
MIKSFFREILRRDTSLDNPLSLRAKESSDLLNEIAVIVGAQTYLEIGVESGLTFMQVNIEKKTGVDPKFHFDYQKEIGSNIAFYEITSDVFFQKIDKAEISHSRFDLIFIDGLHVFDQVLRDFINSIRYVNFGGVIVIDDTVPIDEFSALPSQVDCYKLRKASGKHDDGSWHGDVYKLVDIVSKSKFDKTRIATVTDMSNPKTVIWMEDGDWSSFELESNLEHKTYYELFEKGIPESFVPIKKRELFNHIQKRFPRIN